MSKRPILRLVPLCGAADFQAAQFSDEPLTLRALLQRAPALSLAPISEELMSRSIDQLLLEVREVGPEVPLFRPPGMQVGAAPDAAPRPPSDEAPSKPASPTTPATAHPARLSDEEAVRLAYAREVQSVASFLRTGLSALVICDKLVVRYLWREMARGAALTPVLLEAADDDEGGIMPRGLRQRQIATLKSLTRALKVGDVLIIPHLDLLAGSSDSNMSNEAREIVEILYEASDRLILAFADRSLAIPEVLAARFDVRQMISGVSRTVVHPDGKERLLGEALVTADEAGRFSDYEAADLYKNVAGMNPVRLRHAIAYAVKEHASNEEVRVRALYQAIRTFKVQTSANFEVPNVKWTDIGGYDDVKAELERALDLMVGSYQLPNEKLQRELIPRGFIFHGPPGTGKTLFAKAIASRLNATIQVVSGPEVTDMYVGESERKVREIFAEARRNAPAVLVFDEFDSIATRRSGRDDGGSRAGNALVAQILTEMDGFRPDVPMLVIGTTNRLDIIDEALLRPSRFQAIAIGLPDPPARRMIARVHAGHFGIELSPSLLEVITRASDGFNGDEIRSLFRDACVGLYCENPPKAADARRFGMLVGRIRSAADQRAMSAARRPPAAQAAARGNRTQEPSGAVFSLLDLGAASTASGATPEGAQG